MQGELHVVRGCIFSIDGSARRKTGERKGCSRKGGRELRRR